MVSLWETELPEVSCCVLTEPTSLLALPGLVDEVVIRMPVVVAGAVPAPWLSIVQYTVIEPPCVTLCVLSDRVSGIRSEYDVGALTWIEPAS